MKYLFLFLVLISWLPLLFVFAQTPSFGHQIEIRERVEEGDLICQENELFVKCKNPYDQRMVGVIGESATLVFGKEGENKKTLIYFGIAKVKATNLNGEIKKGDFLTSSKKEGFAQKAILSGYVLGKALEDFSGNEGKILAQINIQYQQLATEPPKVSLSSLFRKILEQMGKGENLPQTLRYIFAVTLALFSFLFGYLYFGRVLREEIAAIGRNPLAKSSIRTITILNLFGIAILTIAGLGLALFVILY